MAAIKPLPAADHPDWNITERTQTVSPLQVEALKLLRDGKSYREIAEAQNVPMGTVRSRINRGRAAMAPKPEAD